MDDIRDPKLCNNLMKRKKQIIIMLINSKKFGKTEIKSQFYKESKINVGNFQKA